MQYKTRSFMLTLAVALAILLSAVGSSHAYADDGAPPAPSTEEATAGGTEQETPPETTSNESVPEDGPPTVEEAVAEILAVLPEGTDLVVVNETGEVEPLATQAAAALIATGDPIWCPAGVAPGGIGCSGNYSDFAALLVALAADAASPTPQYTGSGVIWVEASYNGQDNAQIVFNGQTLTNLNGSNLTIQGGWNGNLDGLGTITGASLADVSMVFVNWTGNITIRDFVIQNTTNDVGFGLFIGTDGAVTLDNVSVSGTTGSMVGNNDGAIIISTNNVSISNSQFNANDGSGLTVASAGGDVTLTNVSASNNTLTGANLDTCLYDGATCQAAGNVTISGAANPFTGNGFDGLFIDSGGFTHLQNVQANNNGLNGAYITNGIVGDAGDVQISNSTFNSNGNATGLEVHQYSNAPIALNNVTATGNNMGAILDTTGTSGAINVSNSTFSNNDYTGLHADSGSNVSLASVVANNNGANGGYLTAGGSITVANSQFNDNVHFNFPQDPGLYAEAQGAITLTNVTANGNDFGAGAVLVSNNTGDINVNGGQFNANGAFGIQAENYNGGITLMGIVASYNAIKGAYLTTNGLGNILIDSSIFVENGEYGIYASADEGNITLQDVIVTGEDGLAPSSNPTDIGALLQSWSGNIFVENSIFQWNTVTGLVIVTNGQINLLDVTADQNGLNGAEFYSHYTWGCLCPGDVPSSTVVYVDGGAFTNNGEYGLLALPGPEGNLVFVNPPTTAATIFGGNGLGDFLLDLAFVPENCDPCACGECCDEDPNEGKKPLYAPVTPDAEPVLQDCENTTGTIWQTPDGTWVKVGCPFSGYSLVQSMTEDDLPGALGAGVNFEAGITVSLTDENGNIVTVNPDGSITITFKLPTSGRGRSYSILFWDPTLNDGKGGWVQLPPFEVGTSFPLHPEDPNDPRLIVSGVREVDGTLTVTVNFPGIFVLVSR